MDVRELAEDFAAMVAAGDMEGAALKHWADDLVTREAMDGENAETNGREEAVAKAVWWYENHEIHGFRSEGPFVNGDSFMLIMDIDVTRKGGQRTRNREIVAYKVANGKIVEERYFY